MIDVEELLVTFMSLDKQSLKKRIKCTYYMYDLWETNVNRLEEYKKNPDAIDRAIVEMKTKRKKEELSLRVAALAMSKLYGQEQIPGEVRSIIETSEGEEGVASGLRSE